MLEALLDRVNPEGVRPQASSWHLQGTELPESDTYMAFLNGFTNQCP